MSSVTQVQGVERAAPLFAALGDPMRLELVARLSRHGPQSISTLAVGTTISRQAVTKHLHVLEGAGLAESRRSGRERIFELRPERLAQVHRYLDRIARQWDRALDRLRVHVEGGEEEDQEGAPRASPSPKAR